MPDFIPGLQLNEAFYREAVGPILDTAYPSLAYSAALIGYGSDVLGFDDARSTDHMWGPRLWLFLSEKDFPRLRESMYEVLRHGLPTTFRGYSTHYGAADGIGVRLPQPKERGPVDPLIFIRTVSAFSASELGTDLAGGVAVRDWLAFPQQHLLHVTAGAVFHDGLGELTAARRKLAWYPDEVWRAMLAAQWQRIAHEEAFVARCGEVGDDLGSAVVAARLVRDVMRLCFLMERRYAPYSKWLGTAFVRSLACGPALAPVLQAALAATDWRERERHLSAAYETVAAMHNALGLTTPLSTQVSEYYGRPALIIHGDHFADALRETLTDPLLRLVASVGALDQFADSTDVNSRPARLRRLLALYGDGE